MYLKNKYTTWYEQLISNAQSRDFDKSYYFEKHHIIPRSLGGTNDYENIVKLTAKEHFICHLLLTKMTTGKAKRSMACAAMAMTHIDDRPRYAPKARTYEYMKKNLSNTTKGLKKTYASFLNRRHTEETKKLQSRVKMGAGNPNFGRKPSEEWIKLVREKQLGIPKPKFTCSVCGKVVGGKSNLLRWHNDKCKRQ